MGLSDKVKNVAAGGVSGVAGKVSEKVDVARVLAGTGIIKPARPDQLVRMGLALQRWGFTPATGWAVGAARWPKETAVVDDFGSLTFAEIDEQSSAIATALAEKGVKEGAAVGVLMRNTRWFLLTRVDLPLARPSIMAGVNQTILMCLSMVVIASLIGAKGLGEDVLNALQYAAVGQGLLAGLAILLCAIVIDRVVQGNFGKTDR